jgi:hypothetical protein
MGGYFAVVMIAAGVFFPLFVEKTAPGTDPAALLDTYLLAGLLGLVAVRFFLQPSLHTDVRPYLHLPLDHARLARVVLGLSVVGLINGLALCFLVPVWFSTVLPAAAGLGGALAWSVGVGALVLTTHYLVLRLRILSDRHGARFWGGAALVVGLLALDQTVGPQLVPATSAWFFDTLAQGGWAALVLPLLLLGSVFVVSVRLFLHSLRTESARSSRRWGSGGGRWLERLTHAGPAGALVAVGVKLVLRNNRAFIPAVMGVLAVAYVLMLADDGFGFMLGFAGLISSGGFALFYGQNIFSWSGAHLPGLLTRAPSLRTIVRARLRLLQGSCLVLYLLALPLYVWFLPDFLLAHTTFLFFNAGVICPLILLTALFATKAVDLSAGVFSNQGGNNWVQLPFGLFIFLFAFAVGIPPAPWPLWLAGGLGLLGLLASPLWTQALTRLFAWRRYRMLDSFRSA